MQTQAEFSSLEQELLLMQRSPLEEEILYHWRSYEPKLMEALLTQGTLRRSLAQKASDLLAVQKSLEKMDALPPSLARMEAWNRLMRITEDEAEEAEAWGMTLEEYRNRP